MNSSRLKLFFSVITWMLICQASFAQSNYYKYTFGFGGGINSSYTDVYKGNTGYTTYGIIDYNITPFATVGLEGQYGMIQGGDIAKDPYNRQFVNKYSSITFNAKMMLGELIDYDPHSFLNNLRGLYLGIGLGVINNKITDVVRQRPSWSDDPGYVFPGKDKSTNLNVPVNLGFNYFISDGYGYQRYAINVNAQLNYTYGDEMDGYNDPGNKFKNNNEDIFVAYTIGLRYMFGPVRVSRRTF